MSSTYSKKNHKIATKVLWIILAILLMAGISIATAFIVHKNDKSNIPASTTVNNGLSAYELAVQYGYNGFFVRKISL